MQGGHARGWTCPPGTRIFLYVRLPLTRPSRGKTPRSPIFLSSTCTHRAREKQCTSGIDQGAPRAVRLWLMTRLLRRRHRAPMSRRVPSSSGQRLLDRRTSPQPSPRFWTGRTPASESGYARAWQAATRGRMVHITVNLLDIECIDVELHLAHFSAAPLC